MTSSPDGSSPSKVLKKYRPPAELAEALAGRVRDLPADWAMRLTHWFAHQKRAEGLRILGLMGELSAGVDECGMDAVCWAARGGDEDCLLLAGEACGASRQDGWGGGPLHHWAETKMGSGGAGAQILMAFGARPATRDRWGFLPMHWSRDSSVWAWSMAALWSIGEPSGWARCGLGGWEAAVDVLRNPELAHWLELSPWGCASLATSPSSGGAQAGAAEREIVRVEIRERQQMMGQMSELQNCIAQELGIQLLLGAELT